MPGVLLQQHRTGIRHGVHSVAQSIELAGAIPGLPVQQTHQIVPDGSVVVGIHILLNVVEHLHDLGVGAAVERPLQGAHRSGDGAVSIRTAGGQRPAHEGGVVAAAVLGMEHQHHIQQMGLLLGIAFVRTDHPQEVLRRAESLLRVVDVQGLAAEMVALDGVGIGHDGGKIPDKLHRLAQQIVHRQIVRIRVVGVQRQDAAAQLIHDVAAGAPHDHPLGEALRQFSGPVHDLIEVPQLPLRGQISHQQQIRHLLEPEGSLRPVGLHNVVKLDAPVVEPSGNGDALAVLQQIALHAAHLGDAHHHTGAVAVSQTPLDLAVVILLPDMILLPDLTAQRPGVLLNDAVFLHPLLLSPSACCPGDCDFPVLYPIFLHFARKTFVTFKISMHNLFILDYLRSAHGKIARISFYSFIFSCILAFLCYTVSNKTIIRKGVLTDDPTAQRQRHAAGRRTRTDPRRRQRPG